MKRDRQVERRRREKVDSYGGAKKKRMRSIELRVCWKKTFEKMGSNSEWKIRKMNK